MAIEWKEIKNTNGYYSVSKSGAVRSNRTGRILCPILHSKGYIVYNLNIDGVRATKYAHRIVAEAFLDLDCTSSMQVDHVNGVKHDNRIENLRLVTPSQNNRAKITPYGSSKYRGVHKDTRTGKWVAMLKLNGKNHHLGYWPNESDAAVAWNVEANLCGYSREALNVIE